MAIRDLTSERLYIDAALSAGARLTLTQEQAHYLTNVLRLSAGCQLLAFNGQDGEWLVQLTEVKKRTAVLTVDRQLRAQSGGPDIDYLFAPLKRSRLDYMVQKAVEMGVARLRPVLTQRTIAERVNLERMRANAIEAAEQCGVLRIPEICEPMSLEQTLAAWDHARPLIFCDEAAKQENPLDVLGNVSRGPVALLIGPEGGFDARERQSLLDKPFVRAISLGPRIMRADTAAVAALALVNARLGDWN
jgi:16S rRNA (uracil1498-N3)-methyltransferase